MSRAGVWLFLLLMPYGLPKEKDTPANNAKMERCVKKLVSEGKSKVSAIKICKSSIMNKPKQKTAFKLLVNSGLIDNDMLSEALSIELAKSMVGKPEDYLTDEEKSQREEVNNNVAKTIKKQDDEVKETEESTEDKTEEAKTEETKEVKTEEVEVKDEEVAKKEDEAEAKTEESKEGESKETEAEEAKPEESEAEEAKEKEAPKAEETVEKKDESEEPTVAEVLKATLENVNSLAKSVTKMDEKLDGILAKQDKAVSEEAVTEDEETPKEEAEATPKEEVKETEPEAEAEKPEAEEKVEKVNTSSEGVLLKALHDIQERIEALEELPAPSNIRVSKVFGGTTEDKTTNVEAVKKIDDRLAEIDKSGKTRGHLLEEESAEAFELINSKQALNV